MITFIGSTHGDDVYEFVYNYLTNQKPDCITIETTARQANLRYIVDAWNNKPVINAFEQAAGTIYGLNNKIPTFFIDDHWNSKKVSYYDINNPKHRKFFEEQTTPFWKYEDYIGYNNMSRRNRHMANVINKLLESYKSITHIGGIAHHTSDFGEKTLQELVNSDYKIICAVLGKEITGQCKKMCAGKYRFFSCNIKPIFSNLQDFL